jgi:LysM repeat protein
MGINMGLRFHLIVFICLWFNQHQAQVIPLSVKTEKVNGQKVYVHIIKKGQTLYGISKAYQVGTAEIEKLNPQLKGNLPLDQVIYIPFSEIESSTKVNSATYIVQPGEGLFAIARKTGLSVQQLKEWNTGLDSLLKAGQEILLKPPVKTENYKEQKNAVSDARVPSSNLLPADDGYLHIGCILPFYLDKNHLEEPETSESERPEKVEPTPEISGKSYKALDFYSGLRFALDSLERAGHLIHLHTFNCENDSASLEGVLGSDEIAKCHLITGPFIPALNNMVADYCKANKRFYLSLFSQQTKILLNNPKAFKLSPSASTQARKMAKVIGAKYPEGNVIIIHNNLKKEKILVDAYRNLFKKTEKDSANLLVFKGAGIAGLKTKLKNNTHNILVVCSNDQAFVTDFFNKLESLEENYKIVVAGMENWQDYENIPAETFEKFSLHLPVVRYFNYEDPTNARLMHHYRSLYHTDPGEHSLLAMDVALGIFPLFARGKNPAPEDLLRFSYKGYSQGYQFEKTSAESGFENTITRIFYYQNLQLNACIEN